MTKLTNPVSIACLYLRKGKGYTKDMTRRGQIINALTSAGIVFDLRSKKMATYVMVEEADQRQAMSLTCKIN